MKSIRAIAPLALTKNLGQFTVVIQSMRDKMNIKSLSLAICTAVVGFMSISGPALSNAHAPSIDSVELKQELAAAPKPFLLDVRQPDEYNAGHIEGSVLIPLSTLETRLAEVPKDKPVVVYCRSGRRSSAALNILMRHGFTNARNLNGGFIGWEAQ